MNATRTGQLKVCKTLANNAGALAGDTFTFDVSSAVGPTTISVVAGNAGTTACKLFPYALPLGSSASVTEESQPNVQLIGVSVSPAGNDAGSTSTQANITIGAGTTTATFTNQADGTLEVCKNAADASTATQTFQFTVNGGSPISVHAGQCSQPISVPAGTATVNELAKANFHLVYVSANDSRLLSGPTDNPATVSVPFGGVANETAITFTNAVNTGQFKICKVSSEPSLQGVTFTFDYQYAVSGVTTTGTVNLQPGQCSALSSNIPVVDAQGNPITVNVAEELTPTVAVSNISYQGNGELTAANLTLQTASFTIGQGGNAISFTNVRTPPPPPPPPPGGTTR